MRTSAKKQKKTSAKPKSISGLHSRAFSELADLQEAKDEYDSAFESAMDAFSDLDDGIREMLGVEVEEEEEEEE